jgi:hypothetical protein
LKKSCLDWARAATSLVVKPEERWVRIVLCCLCIVLPIACSSSKAPSGGSQEQPDAYGASFQGDGVQCGAIICSGAQQCCLVYVAPDASSSNPTHKCDQNCVSQCADTCPDSGQSTGGGPPPAGGRDAGMAGMTGMPPAGGMPDGGMPMPAPGMPGGSAGDGGPSSQDAATD